MIYPPSLAKQPFQAPPLGGIGELGAGVCVWGYTPLLGAANFFNELDSSGASTKATAGQSTGG
jgi:hypothetical protein